jgi:sugar lactone lactonase YvrE
VTPRRYVVAVALLCAILYFVPVLSNSSAFPTQQPASVVLGQPIFSTGTSYASTTGMDGPSTMAFDRYGDLWVADYHNNRVLEFLAPVTDGEAASIVLGQASFTTTGTGDSATTMDGPSQVAFDSSGNLWVADRTNNRVLEFLAPFSTGEAANIVLGQGNGFNNNGAGDTQNEMTGPQGIAFDSSGNLWVADQGNSRVLEFLKTGFATEESATLVLGQSGFTSAGTGDTATTMHDPFGIAFDSSGNLWVSDQGNSRVLEFLKGTGFTTDEAATRVLGQSSFITGAAAATATGLSGPSAIAFDSSGNLWVADQSNSRVVEFPTPFTNGEAATLELGQSNGFGNSSPGDTAVDLSSPSGVTFDSSGNLWVADQGNNRVLQFLKGSGFTLEESATLVLGQQQTGFTTSAATNTATALSGPTSTAFDQYGDLWVVDGGNNRVLEYPKGTGLTTGEAASIELGQSGGFNNGGVGHTQNSMDGPIAIAFDSSGDLWVSDRGNNRILEFIPPFTTGEAASLVLGQSSYTTSASGDSANQLSAPNGIAFDSSGNLWVADSGNNRVVEFPKGAGFITDEPATIAIGKTGFGANGGGSGSGDTSTQLNYPTTLAFDSAHNLWVADQGNNRILEFLVGTGLTTGEAATTVLGQTSFTGSGSGTSSTQLHSVFGITFDSFGNLWAADEANNRVVEFAKGSGFTNDEAATAVLGQTSFTASGSGTSSTTTSYPIGLGFDSAGNLWVADLNNNRVLEFLGPVTTSAAVACPTSSTAITDVGATVTCTASVTGQSGSISGETITWSQTGGTGSVSFSATTCTLSGSPETCSVTVTGVTAGSATVQASYPGDSNNLASSNTAALTINSALSAGAVAPTNPAVDLGQPITLTADPSGGTAPYTYQWYSGSIPADHACSGDAAISGATSSTYTLSPVMSAYYCYKVTDSASTPVSVSTAIDAVTVKPALGTPSLSPSSATMDLTATAEFTVSWSGGSTGYTVNLYIGSSSVCASDTTVLQTQSGVSGNTAQFFISTPASNSFLCTTVTDSATLPETTSSPGDSITVNPALSAGVVTPSAPVFDSGQGVTLTANPSGGTTPYLYQWYTGSGCTSEVFDATASTYHVTSGGTYGVAVFDSSYGLVESCSSSVTVTVNPALTAGAITPSSPAIDSGQSITLTANPSGGTAPFTYQWYTSPSCTNPVSGATSSSYSASSAATYYVKVVDSSSVGAESACSSGDTLTIAPTLTAGAITPPSPNLDNGQSITLTAHVSGGTSPFTYQWYTGASCTSPISGATSSTYSASSIRTYYYQVTDSASPPISACSPGDLVTVSQALGAGAISPSSASIDLGQSVALTANPTYGTSPYTYQWYSGSSATCSSDSAIGGATSGIFSASPASSTYYCYQVTDSANTPVSVTSATALVTVNAALGTPGLTPSLPAVDAGQSLVMTVSWAGGTSTYTVTLYSGTSSACVADTTVVGFAPSVSGSSTTFSVSPASNTYYCAIVTDSAPTRMTTASSADSVAVNPILTAGAIAPVSPTIDLGQSVTLTANPGGGTVPRSYQWYTGSGCTTPVSGATGSTYSASPTSTVTYYVKVTDSATTPTSTCSSGDVVTVNAALSAGSVSPASPSIDAGQSVILTANAVGGTGPYSYRWYSGSSATCSSDSAIGGATSGTFSASPASSTYYCYQVTDSASARVSSTSATTLVTVDPALTVHALSPPSPFIDAGQSLVVTVSWSGGTSTYTVTLYSGASPTCSSDTTLDGTTPGVAGTSTTFPVLPTSNTYYCATVTDSALTPTTTTSSIDYVTVDVTLNVGATAPSSPSIDVGQSVTLTATPSGGTGPYTYQWFTSSDCSTSSVSGATGPTYSASPTLTTPYYVQVTDSSAAGTVSA